MRITILTIGKLKESYWRDAETEYLKRLSAFTKIDIKEIKEEKFSDKDNFDIIKQKEAKKILSAVEAGKNAIPKDSYIIALDKDGTQFTSEQFSTQLQQLEQFQQYNNISFVIGGPLGLDETILEATNESISFSKSTFTHQMIRIILLEQLYRGFMIKEGRKYHY